MPIGKGVVLVGMGERSTASWRSRCSATARPSA